MKDQNQAYIWALLSVACWATMSSAFKLTLAYIDFKGLVFWATSFATIVLFILLWVNGQWRLLRWDSKSLASSALMGAINPFLYYLVLFRAYELLKAQEAGSLNYTWPIVLVLMSAIFLKQSIRVLSYVAIFISFMGVLTIGTGGNFTTLELESPLGVALALFSSVLWASYWILNLKDKRQAVVKIWMNLFFGWLYLSIYMLALGRFEWPSSEGLTGALYIGIFEMGITFVFWLKALEKSTDASKVSQLIYFSPFLALIVIRISLGEAILMSTIIGLILIISGVIIQQFSNQLHNKIRKYVSQIK